MEVSIKYLTLEIKLNPKNDKNNGRQHQHQRHHPTDKATLVASAKPFLKCAQVITLHHNDHHNDHHAEHTSHTSHTISSILRTAIHKHHPEFEYSDADISTLQTRCGTSLIPEEMLGCPIDALGHVGNVGNMGGGGNWYLIVVIYRNGLNEDTSDGEGGDGGDGVDDGWVSVGRVNRGMNGSESDCNDDDDDDDDVLSVMTEHPSAQSPATSQTLSRVNTFKRVPSISGVKSFRKEKSKVKIDDTPTIITKYGHNITTHGRQGDGAATKATNLTNATQATPSKWGTSPSKNQRPPGRSFQWDEETIQAYLDHKLHDPNDLQHSLVGYPGNHFPTRAALEDEIKLRIKLSKAHPHSPQGTQSPHSPKSPHSIPSIQRLQSLLSILPTLPELTEMLSLLQLRKERALRELNLELANAIQVEMEELEWQIREEEHCVLRRECLGREERVRVEDLEGLEGLVGKEGVNGVGGVGTGGVVEGKVWYSVKVGGLVLVGGEDERR